MPKQARVRQSACAATASYGAFGAGIRRSLSRAALLGGVSLIALASAAVTPARAGAPPVLSSQWLAARAQALRASAGAAAATVNTPTAAAQKQANQSIADLSKMAAAIRAAQAFQASAAAVPPAYATAVPNGLVATGLVVAPGATTAGNTLWIGANLPTQSAAAGRTTVTVTQTQSLALLNWQSFNIGPQTTLAFDQTTNGGNKASTWIALNKVPASVSPSQILGSITAAGKVYLINQSGILFGAGSQVNVNSLIASAADLPASITPGANGGAASVTFSPYGAQSGSDFAASFLAASAGSTVDVAAGAQITTSAPASASAAGGYVMLFGGSAVNAGSISTPYGQTVLASGQNFVLRPGYSTTGNATATTRGTQVATVGIAGSTENDGIITATDGDITLVGHNIAQNGVAIASTSVNVRGTVHLLSDTSDTTASITLSPGSVTAVLPDDSQDTALNSQRGQLITQSASLDLLRAVAPSASNPQVNNVGTLADRQDLSRIEITTGGSVEFAAGSLTMAQGGQLAVQAAGRVQADTAAALDVSGQLNVLLPMSANELAISVQSFEQRDAPVNRLTGLLDSTTVTLDARDLVLVPASTLYPTDRYYSGGGLLEVSGYLNTTGHTIGEWTSLGGTITLAASEVVAQTASVFNLAGGSLSYQGGMLHNTYLVGTDGQLYNANTAPATQQYSGIYQGQVVSYPRWNVTNVYTNPLFAPAETYQAGYVVGRDAGSLIISAPTTIFEGAINAGVVNGPYQTTARSAVLTDGYAAAQNVVAQAGSLSIGQYSATGLSAAFASDVRFDNATAALADSLTVATSIPASREQTVWLSSAAINNAGLGGLLVATTESIRVADAITLAPGGTVSLISPTIDLAAGIVARGGRVSAGNILVTQIGTVSSSGALGHPPDGQVLLSPAATIDTRGIWTNARLDPADLAGEAYVNGGNVTLDTTGTLSLAAGSLIDASSGGALLAGTGTLSGKGGSVTLIGNDPAFATPGTLAPVTLAGTVRAYGVSGGGTLTLVAPALELAGSPSQVLPGTIWLGADVLDRGFTTYDLTGETGLAVADGTVITATAPVYQITAANGSAPTGTDPGSAMPLWLPPLYAVDPLHARVTQRTGVSLVLRADVGVGSASAHGGPLTVGAGAVLAVDPGQSVRVEGYDLVTVKGTITAPGGSIAVLNTREENFNFGLSPNFYDGLSVWLGPNSVVDASAQAFTATDVNGRGFGVVPSGGTITLGSLGGSQGDGAGSVVSTDAMIIVRPGAVVAASGTQGIIDPAAGTGPAAAPPVVGGGVATNVASNGGTIAISSYSGIYLDGALQAFAGGAGAAGGTLALTMEAPLYATGAPIQPSLRERLQRTIVVTQQTQSDLGAGPLVQGQQIPFAAQNEARISVAQISAGGFASVSLFARDAILFQGNVSLDLSGSIGLYQGIIAETWPHAEVSLSAPYVLISGSTSHTADNTVTGISLVGVNWQPNIAPALTTLDISADLIDLSNDIRFGGQGAIATGAPAGSSAPRSADIAYDGFSAINLASAGDIRFTGANAITLVTPGNLSFIAAQLYPTTNASAAIYAGVDYYLPPVLVAQSGGTLVSVPRNIYAPGSAITVAWNGTTATAPYSVGGSLVLAAPTIEQGGVIRAPEGNITLGAVIEGPTGSPANQNSYTSLVELRPGSITSVSAAGQTIPYGGTSDDVTYSYNGQAVSPLQPGIAVHAAALQSDSGATIDLSGGGDLTGAVFQTGKGGSVDTLLQPLLTFTGTALVKATLASDPVYAIVPGLLGGYAPTAPVDATTGGSVPAIGLDITLTSAVPGLAAGTYALLPSYYALLPGAYRVELNTTTHSVLANLQPLPDGSFVEGGYTSTANTQVRAALPVPVTLTPGSVVRDYAQYDETSYSQYQITFAASTGAPRAAIPADAKQLTLVYPSAVLSPGTALDPDANARAALSYAGVSLFAAAAGGYDSTVAIEGKSGASVFPNFEITPDGATATPGFIALRASDLDALGAARLVIGGSAVVQNDAGAPTVTFTGLAGAVAVRAGAVLTAPEVFLTSTNITNTGAITVEAGATINTVGAGSAPYDSNTGYFYNANGSTVLAVSNGRLDFTPDVSTSQDSGPITIADGARLTAAGTLAFSTINGLSLGAKADYGAPYLSLDVASVNILSSAVPTTGISLPSGLNLSQAVVQRLLAGDPATGVPPAIDLTLTATQSVNLFGAVNFSTAGGALQQFVLNTPAIYGWSDLPVGATGSLAASGGAVAASGVTVTRTTARDETASISAGSGTLIWNGIATSVPAGSQTLAGSQLPGGYANTGLAPQTGALVTPVAGNAAQAAVTTLAGTLDITAGTIVLGYPAEAQVQNQISLGRTIVGYDSVVLHGTQMIEGSNQGSLSVYATPASVFGQPGGGGTLMLDTPVLTGAAGAVTKFTAGGALALVNSSGATAATTPGGLGAEIDLSGTSISLASTVALASGRFTATAQSGVSLTATATLDLAGRSAAFFDQSSDTPGGSVALRTAGGGITQAAGSVIDVSAGAAPAGSVSVTALAGTVDLAGSILGGAASGQTQGSITVQAGVLANFTALNTALTAGGVTGARSFQLATGDLTVGNELVANTVSLSLDAGTLTIDGTINASGAAPGTVDLAAGGGLTLATGALIDAHATVLHTDSYGAAIDALNAPQVTLTTTAGTLTLQAGAAIDVSSADGVARGQITLNVPRVGTNDLAIAVGGPVSIKGVWTTAAAPSGSLALYGWASEGGVGSNNPLPLDPASGTALLTQSYLDMIDATETQPFMAAASVNSQLQARLHPLIAAAGGAFHLRPGLEIDSDATDGSMAVSGDINLANYRYGANRAEPGALVLRASGSLIVNGSITDGFGTPADSAAAPNPDDNGWVLFAGSEPFGADVVLPLSMPAPITLGAGTTIATTNAVALNYPVTLQAATLNQGVVIPAAVQLDVSGASATSGYVIPTGGWVATAPISDANNHVVYHQGDIIPAGTVLQPGWTLAAGSVLPFQVNVVAGTVWPAGASLRVFNNNTVTLAADQTLPGGAFIPSGTTVAFADGSTQENLRDGSSGTQGQIWAIAPMLPAGSLSWSIGLVSGADLAAANRFAVQTPAALAGNGSLILSDLHYTAPNLGATSATPSFSVIRTGQGNLTIASGGDITEYSLYGIYTAGTQAASVGTAFQQPQAGANDGSGTVLGAGNAYNAFTVNYQAYYPTGGGNVVLSAQGGLYGDMFGSNTSSSPSTDWVGNWLWRQGTGGTAGVAAQSTAWWINFGSYVLPLTSAGSSSQPALTGFTGIGTLGGGNLTVTVAGDAGVTVGRNATDRSQGLDLAVAGTGRVTGFSSVGGVVSGGTLVQTGGGDLTVTIGGTLNGLDPGAQSLSYDGLNGTFTDLRGNITVQAGQIGRVVYQYGTIDPVDTRPLNPYVAEVATEQGGLIVVPGDSQVSLTTLRDLVLGGAGDAGRLPTQNQPGFSFVASGSTITQASGAITAFSLWTQATAITLTSLGGNVTPTAQPLSGSLSTAISNDMPTDDRFEFPPTLNVRADSGSIYYGTIVAANSSSTYSLELAPAATGQLQLLAQGSIYAAGYSIDISGANANSNLAGGDNASALPNPFLPAYTASAVVNGTLTTASNTYAGAVSPYALFAFGPDTPTTDLHANDSQPARVYAATGDIVDLRFGEILNFTAASGITPSTWYLAAKPAWILAGRDIVAAGTRPSLDATTVAGTVLASEPNETATANPSASSSGNLILNDGSGDISVVSAGRDILSSYFYIAGPGLLEVDAGRNFNQQNLGLLKSIGPIFDVNATNRDGGASISVLDGTGAAGIDAADFARLYFNPANQADPADALTAPQNQGKVAETYGPALLSWLQQSYGYSGGAGEALAYFLGLPREQQDVFVRQVFFAELLAAGREESNPSSRRYHSYVRGTEAMYALLPWTPAPTPASDPNDALDSLAYASVVPASVLAAEKAGTAPRYAGDITMTSQPVTVGNNNSVVFDAGISTQFGGNIQIIVPGGQLSLGQTGGPQPGSNTGLITFGSGNIEVFARGSIVLGQSRVFTTYGGSIQLWSATGDVNAGIGTKTSVVYQPPSITYDNFGDLTLAPTAPTNGAGIATLSSVPGVPAGDVDLVAPQGTIDAGEAGIRVSGNLTLAAAAVANSANLSVKGSTQGAPTVAVSNVGALNAAAAASGASENAASGAADDQRRKRQAAEASVIVVEVLGFGE